MSDNKPLMPLATAVWLVDNTALSFSQISQFCQLHELEVQSIADGEDAYRMQGLNPIASGQLTMDEIKRCEGDHSLELQLQNKKSESIQSSVKIKKYLPALPYYMVKVSSYMMVLKVSFCCSFRLFV